MGILDTVRRMFSSGSSLPAEIQKVNEHESAVRALSDDELREESTKLRERARSGENPDDLLPYAFALGREASRRTLGQRHFDVQLWGGIVLHRGSIAEMSTGEGKTLSATLPVYVNALSGKGVHVITVNDYLARRDTVWMGQIYHALGLSTACIVHDAAYMYDPAWRLSEEERAALDKERDEKGSFLIREDFLRPVPRYEAYRADITYGTSHEFGFDYLRDNLAHAPAMQVQRGHHYAIIDEVDSILIDEARTPLIISVPDKESSDYYKVFARAVANLEKDVDYTMDEKLRAVEITEEGITKVEKLTGIQDIFAVENMRIVHYLEASLKAKALFIRDRDYVVRNGEIVIVDQFTGRMMEGRRYSLGLHQAIEAKEDVQVKEESRTYAQISLQNYFRMYEKLAGMTGTAQTSAEEFHKVYGLETVTIPTNRPIVRNDMPDHVYKNVDAKYKAITADVKERNAKGQPVLIGTVSIEKNEALAEYLRRAGIPCEVLNAKNHEREGAIVAQAGRYGAVTVATNMAGRGVDIILGGNPYVAEEAEKVRAAGGLHVIGTERHEARRIDNQLRGRAGRQGDVGSSQFYLSLEDDLMRIFGGDRIKGLMERLDMPDEMPIENRMVSRAIAQAQSRVEGFNFDARKHLLDYDDVLNKQRLTFYKKRQRLVECADDACLKEMIEEMMLSHLDRVASGRNDEELLDGSFYANLASESMLAPKEKAEELNSHDAVRDAIKARLANYENIRSIKGQLLALNDFLWMNHLENVEALAESVRIRAYGQRDPLVEYRRDSKVLFENVIEHFEQWVMMNVFKYEAAARAAEAKPVEVAVAPRKDTVTEKVGRNDPCPCGAKDKNGEPVKYKKCHGK